MKRKSIIFAILCVLMLVSGCSSQSTDDIYQMMENASSKSNGSESSGQSDMVSDNSPRVYTEDYKECNKNYMPELVQTGETAKVTPEYQRLKSSDLSSCSISSGEYPIA